MFCSKCKANDGQTENTRKENGSDASWLFFHQYFDEAEIAERLRKEPKWRRLHAHLSLKN